MDLGDELFVYYDVLQLLGFGPRFALDDSYGGWFWAAMVHGHGHGGAVCRPFVEVDTPGPAGVDLTRLPFRHAPIEEYA